MSLIVPVRPTSPRRPPGPRPRPLALASAVIALSLIVANCSTSRSFGGRHPSEIKYGVASSPRVVAEGQPVPKGGGRDMVGKPYVVAGRAYTPRPGHGYDREGWASWYGTAFHGRLTANGEIFDRGSVAAAHPTLPLPSYVRVTNVVNKRSMIVRVNDRGPYEGGRIIDLSERAAEALDMRRRGTARVRVQYLRRASTDGSDDATLLATLRTDGALAQLDRPQPTLMARAQERERTPSSPPAGRWQPVLASRDGPASLAKADAVPGPARSPRRRLDVAEAEPAEPLVLQPARRPGLAEIY